jgi:hypothetical protein
MLIDVQIFIYALVSTRDNLPRYVGQSWNVEGRRQSHFKNKGRTSNLIAWEKAEREAGFAVEARTLEECNPDKADAREAAWISTLREKGFDLFNGTTGNGHNITPELRAKVLAKNRAALTRDADWLRNMVER